jgi:hypothetical protein
LVRFRLPLGWRSTSAGGDVDSMLDCGDGWICWLCWASWEAAGNASGSELPGDAAGQGGEDGEYGAWDSMVDWWLVLAVCWWWRTWGDLVGDEGTSTRLPCLAQRVRAVINERIGLRIEGKRRLDSNECGRWCHMHAHCWLEKCKMVQSEGNLEKC